MPRKHKNTNKSQKNINKTQLPQTITVLTNLGRYIEIPAHSVPNAVRRGIIDDYIHIEDSNVASKEKQDNSNIEKNILVSGSSMKAIKMLKEINGNKSLI
jgi:hypothetical protein